MIATLRTAGWSLTVLPQVAAHTKLGFLARTLEPGFHTVSGNGYDGQFYWGIAVDPLATGTAHTAFDKASYRYGHPLYGWLAWLVSAGQARAIPAALALIGLASLFAAAAAAAAIGYSRGRSGWESLFVSLSPGLLTSAANDLAEPLAVALLLGVFAVYIRGRNVATWILLALLPLAKEPLILVLVAVAGYELAAHRPRRAAAFLSAAIPAFTWWVYARIQLGAWFTTGVSALGPPLVGWWHALFRQPLAHGLVIADLETATLFTLLIVFTLAALTAVKARPGPAELSYLALAAVGACLAANATAAFTTALRNTAFLLSLVPFVISRPQLLPSQGGRSGDAILADARAVIAGTAFQDPGPQPIANSSDNGDERSGSLRVDDP